MTVSEYLDKILHPKDPAEGYDPSWVHDMELSVELKFSEKGVTFWVGDNSVYTTEWRAKTLAGLEKKLDKYDDGMCHLFESDDDGYDDEA